MYRRRSISGKKGERGVVILVVAIVLLFVVGAMAVLAIDFVSFYTARSEAQLAADSAALAGARVLANSGVTSKVTAVPADTGLRDNARALAQATAIQVAMSNKVGGRNLTAGEVTVSFTGSTVGGSGGLGFNPRIKVSVSRTDLPTFFARIWGRTQLTLNAAATAEAYNPSGLNITTDAAPPVAPICVKPWVLPNMSPKDGSPIFNQATGAIQDTSLIGWTDNSNPPTFYSRCTGSNNSCLSWSTLTPNAWQYYPGAQSTFPEPPPTQTLQSCSAGFQPYQRSIAGCVSTPIACNATVDLDTTNYQLRNTQTADAVNCMTHSEKNNGDVVALKPPNQAFQFQGGSDNPIAGAVSKRVLVSDSLVTVPVYQSNGSAPPATVQIIGFVQLFLNPDGAAAITPATPPPPFPVIRTTIVNLVGCGTNATGTTPIMGNGASPVSVRLVSPGS